MHKGDFKMFPRFNEVLTSLDINRKDVLFVSVYRYCLFIYFYVNKLTILILFNHLCLKILEYYPEIENSRKLNISRYLIHLQKNITSITKKIRVLPSLILKRKTFSTLSILKTKYRNRLDSDSALRLAETTLQSHHEKIINEKQQQISH